VLDQPLLRSFCARLDLEMELVDKKHSSSESIVAANRTVDKAKVQVSVVIPIHNKEKTISILLSKIKEVLSSTFQSYEIVLVNDGSFDNTFCVLQEEKKIDSCLKVISYNPNRGKGYAVKTGVIESSGNIVIFIDGDLDISHSKIEDYVNELGSCDLVVASKRHPQSKVYAPSSRKFLSRTFNLLVRLSIGIKIKDTQSGLKAGNGDILRTIFEIMLVKRYAFDVELITIATMLNLKIKEMPIEINLDHGFRLKDIVKMLLDVTNITYRYRINRWYHKQIVTIRARNKYLFYR
jgi:glycosyltransferase involved in cell wall biosynthesis